MSESLKTLLHQQATSVAFKPPDLRKFTDYAVPPGYIPLGVVTNTGGKVGWERSPLMGPFDLPSRNNPFLGW